MIKVGDKVAVTDVPEGCELVGVEVGSVGEVVKRVDETCVDILFGDGKKFLGYVDEWDYLKSKNCGHTHVFLVEKFDDKEEKDDMLEVGDKVVVTKVVENVLEGVEVGKVGEIVDVDCKDYTKMPYLVDFGDCKWWAGGEFLVEKVEDVETGDTPPEEEIKGDEMRHSVNVTEDSGGQVFALGESFKPYIEERQAAKEIDNSPLEGAYNTIIVKDGLTIYTNYSVDVVGEVMRVGGVDKLVNSFDESENAALEED